MPPATCNTAGGLGSAHNRLGYEGWQRQIRSSPASRALAAGFPGVKAPKLLLDPGLAPSCHRSDQLGVFEREQVVHPAAGAIQMPGQDAEKPGAAQADVARRGESIGTHAAIGSCVAARCRRLSAVKTSSAFTPSRPSRSATVRATRSTR